MPLDVLPVFSILDRITDANGDPVSGGYAEFYEAGTTTPRTVYSDSGLSTSLGSIVYADAGGYPVDTQGGTTKVSVYTGTGAYKVIVKDSGGSTLITRDNIPGALDTSGFAVTSASPSTPTLSKTAAYSVTVNDAGKLINANCTGGSFVITLPSASTAGDGFRIGIRHAGTANTVTIASVGSQSIAQPGPSTTVFTLIGRGQCVWLVSDGSGWTIDTHVPALMRDGPIPNVIKITDRLSAAPGAPTAGARYIVGASPTGAWSTLSFSQHDIAEADGNGSWIKYTPQSGWIAWIDDEHLASVFYSGAWTDWTNVTAPTASALKIAIWADEKAVNTSGGTSVDDAWTTHELGTERVNTITGASLASNQFTLPTGKYKIDAQVSAYAMGEGQIRLYSITNSAVKATSVQVYTANYTSGTGPASILSGAPLVLTAYLNVTSATEVFAIQYYTTHGGAASGLGRVRNIGSEAEVYAVVTVLDLSSIQGPAGPQGAEASVNPTSLVGVNATADTTNRLSVASAGSLFNHSGSNHQLKINKSASGNTASVVLQDALSTRAEIGLTGDDNFHIKVSPDGSSVTEAMIVDKTTGNVGFGTSPEHQVEVWKDTDHADISITSNVGGTLHGRTYGGTRASRTATPDDVATLGIGGRAWHSGGAYQDHSASAIHFKTAESQTATAWGSYLQFLTTAIGSATRYIRGFFTPAGSLLVVDQSGNWNPRTTSHAKPTTDALIVAGADGGTSSSASIVVAGHGVATVGFRGVTSRGSIGGGLTATQSGDFLCFMGGHGHDGTSFTAGTKALLGFKAAENWGASAQGTYITFEVTPTGSTTRAEKARLSAAGYFGVGTTSPSCSMDVAGTIRMTGETTPSSGAGVEFFYTGGNGRVTAYDRTGGAYRPFYLDGSETYIGSQVSGGGPVGIAQSTVTGGFMLDVNGAIRCTSLTQTSDANMKDVIGPVPGLDFISRLEPVTFKWKARAEEKRTETAEVVDSVSGTAFTVDREVVVRAAQPAGKRPHFGVIAQQVKAVADELGIDFGGYKATSVAEPDKPAEHLIDYSELIPPLIAAVKELAARVADLENGRA